MQNITNVAVVYHIVYTHGCVCSGERSIARPAGRRPVFAPAEHTMLASLAVELEIQQLLHARAQNNILIELVVSLIVALGPRLGPVGATAARLLRRSRRIVGQRAVSRRDTIIRQACRALQVER